MFGFIFVFCFVAVIYLIFFSPQWVRVYLLNRWRAFAQWVQEFKYIPAPNGLSKEEELPKLEVLFSEPKEKERVSRKQVSRPKGTEIGL
jgi:hypothetical protein